MTQQPDAVDEPVSARVAALGQLLLDGGLSALQSGSGASSRPSDAASTSRKMSIEPRMPDRHWVIA